MRSALRHLRTRFARAGRILLQREWAGRNMTVFPDDVFLVSYPRSGNTWMRFLVGNLIWPDDPITFANIEARIPYVDLHSDRLLLSLPRPRIFKSHESFFSRYQRVIYIVRDPRDVAISYYHYLVKYRELAEDSDLSAFVTRFIPNETFEAQHGPWADHVMSWVEMRGGQAGFLLVRYEDLIEDANREMGRVANFLGVAAGAERVSRAVSLASVGRMRTLEKSEGRLWKTTKRSRQDKPFVRSATSGQWQEVLSRESVAEIETAWWSAMQALGYSLTTRTADLTAVRRDILPALSRAEHSPVG